MLPLESTVAAIRKKGFLTTPTFARVYHDHAAATAQDCVNMQNRTHGYEDVKGQAVDRIVQTVFYDAAANLENVQLFANAFGCSAYLSHDKTTVVVHGRSRLLYLNFPLLVYLGMLEDTDNRLSATTYMTQLFVQHGYFARPIAITEGGTLGHSMTMEAVQARWTDDYMLHQQEGIRQLHKLGPHPMIRAYQFYPQATL